MKCDCIEGRVRRLFELYGAVVARHPIPFIIVPVVVAAALGGGFAFLRQERDVEYLYTPQNSQARIDQDRLQQDFNIDNYSPSRSLDLDLVARLIITSKEGDSVWDDDSLQEIFSLDDFITNDVGTDDNKRFVDVCRKSFTGLGQRVCLGNGLDLVRTTKDLTFPEHEIPAGPGQDPIPVFLGYLLGGVTTESGKVKDVEAIQVAYHLKDDGDGRAWAEELIAKIAEREYSHIQVKRWHYYSIEDELAANTVRIVPFFSITFTVLISFSITATMLLDQVRAKPWLGKAYAENNCTRSQGVLQ